MNKEIDFTNTVYQICNEYPEVMDILYRQGFEDIVKPGILNTAGRFMTIPKGARMKKKNLEDIKEELRKHGFQINE